MPITNANPEWTSEDTALFRAFLETPTGTRLLPALAHEIPPLLANGDIHSILIRSGEVRGFQEFARTLLAMAYPLPEVKTESADNYPPLENDKVWGDGNKIQ